MTVHPPKVLTPTAKPDTIGDGPGGHLVAAPVRGEIPTPLADPPASVAAQVWGEEPALPADPASVRDFVLVQITGPAMEPGRTSYWAPAQRRTLTMELS